MFRYVSLALVTVDKAFLMLLFTRKFRTLKTCFSLRRQSHLKTLKGIIFRLVELKHFTVNFKQVKERQHIKHPFNVSCLGLVLCFG